MKLTLEITDSVATIEKNILRALAEEFNAQVAGKIPTIRNKIANEVTIFLKATTTYQSLINGDLAGHFGLPVGNRVNMVDNILHTISTNLEVTFKPVRFIGGQYANGISIGVLIKNFTDILSMMEAEVVTDKLQFLPWLEWLLIAGNKMIISEHEIHLRGGAGRSGKAIMVKNNAAIWRVPTQYSGTINNNWLTRAFTDNSAAYLNMISQILYNELN